ncbi:MAG TPA: zinc-dependent metalloprotease family protein [Chitinophagaceae bacterium]|nr:zinc-dependent metalloprotease family protein [Chitinophagaceae bacterium]
MNKLYKGLLAFILTVTISVSLSAQQSFFGFAGANMKRTTAGKQEIFPQRYAGYTLDIVGLRSFLWSLPAEKTLNKSRSNAPVMQLPMPDGKLARFKVWESSIMEPGLAAKFPEMRQFLGQGIDDPYATVRFDFNPYTGFHAQILSAATGRVFIDPYAKGDLSLYMSYYTKDYTGGGGFTCEVTDINPLPANPAVVTANCLGTTMRTYRLALACTGEYAVAVCSPSAPTIPLTAAAMLTSMNRVNGVYETEVSLRMILVANNNNLIYLDGASDPYTNNSGSTMLGENQANIDGVIGAANYDIGHVFSTGGGGVAVLRSPCNAGSKAQGVTGRGLPIGDPFDIDYVAHEMGHQWGGNHSMAGCGSSPNSTKFEVGSGTSIQAYAGICGGENIQPNSDPYFHPISFDEISNYITSGGGTGCGTTAPTLNTLPVINPLPNNGLTIPIGTPFTLEGSATDVDGDALTYSWEQWDIGGGNFYSWNAGATAGPGNTVPLFKSRIPKTNGSRTFPDIAVILAGYPTNPAATMGGLKGETLSPFARSMNFRLTVRDNRAGGGGVVSSGGGGCQSSTGFTVNVAGTEPFLLTAPNGGGISAGGATETITWNVAGTNLSPFNVSNVKISLSLDGGLTYPTVLSASTANDGSETVVLPCTPSTTARVKVEALGNIFFDVSNNNFTIQSGFDFNSPATVISGCPVPASLSTTLGTLNPCSLGGTISLSATGNPPGTTVSFGTNPVAPGSSSTVTLNNTAALAPGNYTITITGTLAGSPVRTRNIVFTISNTVTPSYTTQPAAQTVCVGANASFSVVALDASGYQWQISTGGGPFTDIPGATNPSYTVTGATSGQNGNQYRVIATSACATSTTSNAVTLTVISPVVVGTQPLNREICAGGNTTFSITASSSQTISYQWQVSTNSGGSWTNIADGGIYTGTGTATLNLTNTPVGNNTYQYRCLVNNITCSNPVNSNAAVLTVRPLPTVILSAGALSSLLPGQSTTLTATPGASAGGTLATAWFFNNNPVSNSGNTRVVNVEQVGTYRVNILETYGSGLSCSNQSANVVIDATISDKLFIFPSPNDGRFTVSYYNNGGTSTQRRIIIHDTKGARVYDRQFSITGAYTLLPIDLRLVNRGIYFVSVGDASGAKLVEGKVHIR